MKIRKSKGILIRKTRIQSSSLIAQIFLENGSIVPLIFKGALRSGKSAPAAAYLIPFAILEFVYYEKETRQVQTASSVSVVEDFPEIRRDYETQLKAVQYVKRATSLIKPGQSCPELFDITSALFKNWQQVQKLDEEIVISGFLLKIMTFAGFGPVVAGCASCRGQLTKKDIQFSPTSGGFICGQCESPENAFPVSPQIPKLFQSLLARPIPAYDKLKFTKSQASLVLMLIEKFWAYHIGEK